MNALSPQLPPQRFDFTRIKVLVTDDSTPSLDIISQILLGFGVTNRCLCRTVPESFEKLSAERYDLVIADAEMPDEDAFDLTRLVRENPDGPNFTTPIIIASGYTPVAKVLRARNAGANLVILKPVVPGVLLSRIRWLARGERAFVQSAGYCGPDRRLRNLPIPTGLPERRADALRLMAQPERAMSQDEIDGLFS
jgi:DNA-binding response OmpR family regulator